MIAEEWVVEADSLTRRFGDFVAVDKVTLRVPRHGIFGFLGPTGSGKSTTIRMLCGLLAPSAGSAVVNGFDVARDPERLRQNIGYMAQKFSLYADLTVRENLKFYGGVYGLQAARLRERIEEVLDQLKLRGREGELTEALPLGWKQRVALGSAILHRPPVLFLDEPTSGVDPDSRRLFWNVVDDLTRKDTSIFVSTHTMEEAERCDQVGIMYDGQLIAANSPANLRQSYEGSLFAVEAEPLLDALRNIRALPFVDEAAMFGTALHVTARLDDPDTLRDRLREAAIAVRNVRRISANLEDVFVQQITRSLRAKQERATEIGR